jgi:hypothetical protein
VGFAYPPASEVQLLVIEAALGFPLPFLLRTLYAEIANRGFGPDAGIQGALGGYGTCIDEPVSTIVADYVWHCQVGYAHLGRHDSVQLVDLADYAHQWKQSPCRKSLLLLLYAVCALARRFGMLPAGLPGLRDWPGPSHSSGHQR